MSLLLSYLIFIMYRNQKGFKNENFITHIFKQSAQAADVVQCSAVGAGSSSCTQSKSMSSSCTRPTSWSSIGPRITSRNTKVSIQGVESLWGDCRFIPADWGS